MRRDVVLRDDGAILAAIVVIAAVRRVRGALRTRAPRRCSSARRATSAVASRQFAAEHAHAVTVMPRRTVPTRYGDVAGAVLSCPTASVTRTRAPRSRHSLDGHRRAAADRAREGPRGQRRRGDGDGAAGPAALSASRRASTDVIEDAVGWMTQQPELAPDGRVGIIGISFAGGLSIVAAGRPSIRDKVAFVLSFGGHARSAARDALSRHRRSSRRSRVSRLTRRTTTASRSSSTASPIRASCRRSRSRRCAKGSRRSC